MGFVFKKGIKGLGYYEDVYGTKAAAMAMASSGKNKAGDAAESKPVDDEQIELADLDDDDVEVKETATNIPSALFGRLAGDAKELLAKNTEMTQEEREKQQAILKEEREAKE